MGFFIKDGARVWCGDLRWKQYSRKPSFWSIRHDAVEMGMTHFVRTPQLPNRIGYLKLDQRGEKITPDSLLLSVADHFGAQYFGQYEVGPDQHWLIATDDMGIPLLGSDGIYTTDEIDAIKTSFAGHTFTREDILSEDEFAALQKVLPPTQVVLRSISLRSYYIGASIICASVLVVVQATRVIEQHRLEALRLAAQKTLNQTTRPFKPPPPVAPGDWIRTCIRAARSFQVFVNGWTLGHWDCIDHNLAVTWQRSGGTLAPAPAGEIQDSGNTVVTHILLDVPAADPTLPPPSLDERQFLAFIQKAGETPAIGKASNDTVRRAAGGPVPMLAASFTWRSDPQAIPWNDFRGLHVTQMSHVVTSTAQTGSRNSPTGGYQIQVMLDNAAEPAPRH
ncbi:type 4b pilus protein PilO2 [Komagataeibacter sp. FNDCR2]|uniref:type 4b pilus protein PilO2 n=1 Tax=Komagataeibacter sp. FNDCR2 TaxID=2878682 RepID=UPI001E4A32CA|nr:type 4b pilus protein PilO2 [Komagataeibacter sp. FNDCR2]MCE2576661.1 type 4b pilus protein PilO2 [Komagataeibacter sp. FNDCR2]